MKIGVTIFLGDRSISPVNLAHALEERGYHSLYLPEHTHIPASRTDPPGLVTGVEADDYRRGLDPLVALSMAAAVTERIQLGTGICLVAQHDPVVLAKQVATIDHLSCGRFVFGIGYGWNKDEMAQHGISYAERREIAREKVLCMQALFSLEVASFDGKYVHLEPSYAWPKPLQQPRPRTLVGGAAGPKLFTAVAEYADGWMPIGGAGIADALPRLREAFEQAGRDSREFSVVPFGTIPTEGKLHHYREIGVDEVVLRVPAGDEASVMRFLDDYARFIY